MPSLHDFFAGLHRERDGAYRGGGKKSQKPDKNSIGTLILIALAALVAGGIGWYIKIYKPKKDFEDAEDFDDLIDDGEEETVNEDDEPEQKRDPYGEPDEPDPGDYYGEPEDEP